MGWAYMDTENALGSILLGSNYLFPPERSPLLFRNHDFGANQRVGRIQNNHTPVPQ
jgi:hypothetical protein